LSRISKIIRTSSRFLVKKSIGCSKNPKIINKSKMIRLVGFLKEFHPIKKTAISSRIELVMIIIMI